MDREKVIKTYECCKNPWNRRCEECPIEKDCCHDGLPTFAIKDALELLKEQEDLGTELTNAVELIHKKNERIEKLKKLLKEQQERIETLESLRRIEQEGR